MRALLYVRQLAEARQARQGQVLQASSAPCTHTHCPCSFDLGFKTLGLANAPTSCSLRSTAACQLTVIGFTAIALVQTLVLSIRAFYIFLQITFTVFKSRNGLQEQALQQELVSDA